MIGECTQTFVDSQKFSCFPVPKSEAPESIDGVPSMVLRVRAEGKTGMFVPKTNAAAAAVVANLNVIPVRRLSETPAVPARRDHLRWRQLRGTLRCDV